MGKKQINTEIILEYDSGESKYFKNIEEASKELGISERALKIRCSQNKNIDGVTYKWKNPASHRARKNRRKGNNFELEIINKLKDIGYTGCVSARSESKRKDDMGIDIIDTEDKLPINIQCKYTTNLPNYFNYRDKCPDKSKPFVIIWKKSTNDGTNSPGIAMITDIDLLYDYLNFKLNV